MSNYSHIILEFNKLVHKYCDAVGVSYTDTRRDIIRQADENTFLGSSECLFKECYNLAVDKYNSVYKIKLQKY